MAIKFFIQKDIPQEIQADVCETVAVRSIPSPLCRCSSLGFRNSAVG